MQLPSNQEDDSYLTWKEEAGRLEQTMRIIKDWQVNDETQK